jgi:hypothetical protein
VAKHVPLRTASTDKAQLSLPQLIGNDIAASAHLLNNGAWAIWWTALHTRGRLQPRHMQLS